MEFDQINNCEESLQMLSDPLVLPHADGNISCVRINQDSYASEFLARRAADEIRVRVRHTKTKATSSSAAKDRHNVEITQTIFATSEASEIVRKVYVVFELLPSDSDVKLVDALADWLIASANANCTALVSWQS